MNLIQITHASQDKPATIFRFQERISLENFAELEAITRAEHARGMRNLVLDLSQTPTLSSIGVRAIVIIHKLLTAEGGNPLKIAAAPAPVRDVLQIAGITQFIEVYDTVEAAAASF